jgi:hypothetical protein
MLLSANPIAVTTLFTQGRLVDADGKAAEKVDAGGLKVIGGELKKAKLTKTDKIAIATLVKGDAAGVKLVAKEIAVIDKVVAGDVKKLVAVGKALVKKPTNAKLLASESALKTTLTTVSSSTLTALTNAINTLNTTDDTNSSALSTANPKVTLLGTDVGNYQSALGTSLGTLSSAISLALTTDMTQVLALY